MGRSGMDDIANRGDEPPADVRLVGDVACPWTYMTVRTLHDAFGASLHLLWHPFLLRNQARSVSPAQGETLVTAAAAAGHPLHHANAADEIDSLRCHALLLQIQDRDPALVAGAADALLSAAFIHGAPLTTTAELLEVLPAPQHRLAGQFDDRIGDELERRIVILDRRAREAGIRDIPLTILGDRQVIAGWQPPQAFIALNELAQIERGGSAAG